MCVLEFPTIGQFVAAGPWESFAVERVEPWGAEPWPQAAANSARANPNCRFPHFTGLLSLVLNLH